MASYVARTVTVIRNAEGVFQAREADGTVIPLNRMGYRTQAGAVAALRRFYLLDVAPCASRWIITGEANPDGDIADRDRAFISRMLDHEIATEDKAAARAAEIAARALVEAPAPVAPVQADGDGKMTVADYLDMARSYRADGNEGAAELYESYARDAGATAAAIRRARMVPQPVQLQPVAPPAPGSHRTVMLALDAFEAAPWPRPLVEINPRPAPVLDVLPPSPRYPFAPVLDVPAPAPRPMADAWQSLAVEFGPPLTMHRTAMALRPDPRGFLDFLTVAEAFALYLAAACFGLALVASFL